jgi:hypothetical protein
MAVHGADHRFGGSGAVLGGHTMVVDRMPTIQLRSSAVMSAPVRADRE